MKRGFTENDENRQSPVSVATDVSIPRKKLKVLEPFKEPELFVEDPSLVDDPSVQRAIEEEAVRAELVRRRDLLRTLLQKFK